MQAFIRQVLEGLLYIHSQSVVHRDIKASNLLMTKEHVIKLADFGMATEQDQQNSFAGSAFWVAPEIID